MKIKQFIVVVALTICVINLFATDLYTSSTTLNVRTGPGTFYEVSFVLNSNDEVELISAENGWGEIKFGERNGYVSLKYLNFSRTITTTDAATDGEKEAKYWVIGFISIAAILMLLLAFSKNKKKEDKTDETTEVPISEPNIDTAKSSPKTSNVMAAKMAFYILGGLLLIPGLFQFYNASQLSTFENSFMGEILQDVIKTEIKFGILLTIGGSILIAIGYFIKPNNTKD